jgi:serine/threonine protein kinase
VPPELIAGRYRVEREVGRGGMGSVWLCHDQRLGRRVAMKQVGGLPGESNMHLARALREARHSAALNHPNVVAIFDAIEEGDQVWLVMEYVPSRTLDEIVREDGPLEPPVAARIGADVADGLAAAHALGTVHRDVKPSNILVREDDGRALIADFGIARTVGQEQLTRSGIVTGTPAYFAPELARGHEPSPASDVWALGVALYVAVQGEPPDAESANAIALLNTIASEPPPDPTRAGPLSALMRRMLDPEPGPRTTMAEAARELRQLAVAEPEATAVDQLPPPVPHIPPQDTVPTAARPSSEPRRRRPVALAALAALVVLVLVAAGGWWLTRESGQPTADQGAGPDAGPTGKPSPRRSDRPSSSPGSASVRPSPTPTGSSPSSPATGATTATVSPTPPTAGGVDAGSPAALVTDYYSLLPEDTDSAWNLLTPQLQEQIGEGTYQGFWATIDEVRVESAESVDDDVVQVTLVYTTGGRSEQETRQLAVEQTDGGFLISDDLGAV